MRPRDSKINGRRGHPYEEQVLEHTDHPVQWIHQPKLLGGGHHWFGHRKPKLDCQPVHACARGQQLYLHRCRYLEAPVSEH